MDHKHRVDSARLFLSRPNWDPSTPSPAGERVPPLGSGGVSHSLVGEGVGGGSQFRRGDIHYGTVGILYMYFVITKF